MSSAAVPSIVASRASRIGGVCIDGIDLIPLAALARRDDGTVDPGELWTALATIDTEALADYERLELVAAWQRLENAATAHRWQEMERFRRSPYAKHDEPREFAADELALRLGASRRTADRQLNAAYLIQTRLPLTEAAQRVGRIDGTKAQLIAETTVSLDEASAHCVEASVIDEAVGVNPTTLRRRLLRAALDADPEVTERRHREAPDQRRVCSTPLDDGMAELAAVLPATDWAAISTVINAAARSLKSGGDIRTMDQLRADALVAPFRRALTTGVLDGLEPMTLARHRGAPVRINVTVPASVLLGLSDAPGHLEGYGPLPAALVRRIAVDATWRRILTDPASGTPIDVGTTTYAPPASLGRLVEERDRTCRFPGCFAKASDGDLDHTVAFPAGPTASHNLGALCRRHHRFKHEATGTGVSQQNGTFTWTMPTGHVITEPPPFGSADQSAPPEPPHPPELPDPPDPPDPPPRDE